MGTVTPNIGIFLPSPGETNYQSSFDEGMINIDQHDHSGGPNKGVVISGSGIADGSITYNKLNANVADTSTGIGTSVSLPNQLQILGLLKNIYQLATTAGFISKDGSLAHARTIVGTGGITVTNGDGVAGNPSVSLTGGGVQSVVGTANQIVATPVAGITTLSLAPTVLNSTQPSFLATVAAAQDDVTGDGTAYTVLFPTEIFDQSSNYNNTTSEFTAPNTGVYQMGVNLFIGDLSAVVAGVQIDFFINGSLGYTLYFLDGDAISRSGSVRLCGSQLMKLTAADKVTVVLTVTGVAKQIDVDGGNFSGVLLF